MSIPSHIVPTINYWITNITSSYKPISHGPPLVVLYSNISNKAWGAFNKTNNIHTGGGGGGGGRMVSRRTRVSY